MSLPSVATFKSRAVRMIRQGNPDLPRDGVTYEWLRVSRPYPLHGAPGTGRSGSVRVSAPGYRATTMIASVESNGSMMVR
jgi:hypothetical protein